MAAVLEFPTSPEATKIAALEADFEEAFEIIEEHEATIRGLLARLEDAADRLKVHEGPKGPFVTKPVQFAVLAHDLLVRDRYEEKMPMDQAQLVCGTLFKVSRDSVSKVGTIARRDVDLLNAMRDGYIPNIATGYNLSRLDDAERKVALQEFLGA